VKLRERDRPAAVDHPRAVFEIASGEVSRQPGRRGNSRLDRVDARRCDELQVAQPSNRVTAASSWCHLISEVFH
jgi:hypothetical protein